jgi:hypothetical protein
LGSYYSQDDFVVVNKRTYSYDAGADTAFRSQKRTESSVETDRSPTVRSEPILEAQSLRSPSKVVSESISVQTPVKRLKIDDEPRASYQSYNKRPANAAYDPTRDQYIVYDMKPSFPTFDSNGSARMYPTKQVPKVVEAVNGRLEDAEAAKIPDETHLEPARWKTEFNWPNAQTTTQCHCLMRYFIERLSPWVTSKPPILIQA